MKILFTFNLFLLSLALINTAGCSTSNWYAGMQASHESACLKLPIAEYQDCMQRSKKSYNTYDKERQQLKKQPSQ